MSDSSYAALIEHDYIRLGILCSGCGAWAPKYDCSICEAGLCERCALASAHYPEEVRCKQHS